ncbi:hypothetical protein B0H11DRAFT_1902351 [Mycena galericulata]|nr:hypothetical protein B0H11DRAFT_1902351 [Mycena galericulata]
MRPVDRTGAGHWTHSIRHQANMKVRGTHRCWAGTQIASGARKMPIGVVKRWQRVQEAKFTFRSADLGTLCSASAKERQQVFGYFGWAVSMLFGGRTRSSGSRGKGRWGERTVDGGKRAGREGRRANAEDTNTEGRGERKGIRGRVGKEEGPRRRKGERGGWYRRGGSAKAGKRRNGKSEGETGDHAPRLEKGHHGLEMDLKPATSPNKTILTLSGAVGSAASVSHHRVRSVGEVVCDSHPALHMKRAGVGKGGTEGRQWMQRRLQWNSGECEELTSALLSRDDTRGKVAENRIYA